MTGSELLNNPIILKTENVTKQFGGLVAVNNVSIELHEGEILGLIGANGAGKTTLFNMISGSFRPTSGRVIFNGTEIDKMPPNKICNLGLGRTYQIVQPFMSLTVLENTMVGVLLRQSSVKEAQKKAEEILEFVGLENRKNVVGSALNIPELKRMEVARALATAPKVLLLDEVMAGLNPIESGQVIELVKSIREKGVSIIIIEHVMKAIMNLSDRIYVLNQGKLIATGTPSEITQNSEVIKSYLGEKSYAKG